MSKPLDLVKISYLNTGKKIDGVIKGVASHISSYVAHFFQIEGIKSDPESAIVNGRTEIEEKGVKLELGAKGEHIGIVENNIGTIKEKARGLISLLPFRLTAKLLVGLAFFSVIR